MLKDLDTIKNIFTPIIFVAICCDSWANGFRTSYVYPEMFVGIWLMAVVLAFSGPLLSYYSENDWVATTVSLLCATTSFAISIASGLTVIDEYGTSYMSTTKQILGWAMLVGFGLVPLVTVAATRIVANAERKSGVSEPKRAVPSSPARNQPEKKPVARNQNRAENQEFPRSSREGTSSKLG